MALCSLSTGRIAHAAAPRRFGHDAAGHDEHFLVGQRDRLAVLDGGQHRLEPVGARRGAQHEVDVGMRGHRDEPFASRARDGRAVRRPTARRRSTAPPEPMATIAGR